MSPIYFQNFRQKTCKLWLILKTMHWNKAALVRRRKLFCFILATYSLGSFWLLFNWISPVEFCFTLGRLPHGLKRQIYFNDRLACAQGTKPLSYYGKEDHCEDSYCCNKTLLQVAKWDFQVREKCHILRSIKPDKVSK